MSQNGEAKPLTKGDKCMQESFAILLPFTNKITVFRTCLPDNEDARRATIDGRTGVWMTSLGKTQKSSNTTIP